MRPRLVWMGVVIVWCERFIGNEGACVIVRTIIYDEKEYWGDVFFLKQLVYLQSIEIIFITNVIHTNT